MDQSQNPWINHVKQYASKTSKSYREALADPKCRKTYWKNSRRGGKMMSGGGDGLSDVEEKDLLRDMCAIEESHHGYWCQLCDQETGNPVEGFHDNPVYVNHDLMKSIKKRNYVCKKCKLNIDDPFWAPENCPN